MKAHQLSRRTFYLAAVVAIVASTSGFAMASVLSPPTTVTQSASSFGGSSSAVAGYSTPALAVAASPGGCSAGQDSSAPVIDSATGGVATLVLSAYTGADNCTMNNFAEEFTFAYFSAATTTHVDNFTIYSQVTGGAYQTNYVHLQLGTATSGPFGASIQVFVDYGTHPVAISNLELVIHHP